MRIKKGFDLRNVLGEYVAISEGIENIDFSKVVALNESGAYLWKKVVNMDFTAEDMAKMLTEEYDVDYDTALKDATALAQKLIESGVAEE
ncbi:MAG: PqqD family protein [Prevotella sp.]|nr:PqqD family protein [Candidatus Equicola stercoris]